MHPGTPKRKEGRKEGRQARRQAAGRKKDKKRETKKDEVRRSQLRQKRPGAHRREGGLWATGRYIHCSSHTNSCRPLNLDAGHVLLHGQKPGLDLHKVQIHEVRGFEQKTRPSSIKTLPVAIELVGDVAVVNVNHGFRWESLGLDSNQLTTFLAHQFVYICAMSLPVLRPRA